MINADGADIKFQCSGCGQSLVVDSSGAGLMASCPMCAHAVTVPQLGGINDRHYGGRKRTGGRTRGILGSGRPEYADPVDEELRDELIDATLAKGTLERDLAEAQEALRRTTEDGEQLRGAVKDLTRRLKKAEAELARSSAMQPQLDAAIQAAALLQREKAELGARMDHAAEVARERLLATETQLEVRESELEETRKKLKEHTAELASAWSEHTILRDNSTLLTQQLAAAQTTISGQAQQLDEVQNQLAERTVQWRAAEEGCQSLAICCEELRSQAETFRRDLSETADGRELIDLRKRLDVVEEAHQLAQARLKQLGTEAQRLAACEEKLKNELHETRRLRASAEQRAEAVGDTRLKEDNEVLRGIISRQNGELASRLSELGRLKRARHTLKILSAVIGLALAGLAGFAIKMLLLDFSW